MFKLKEIQLFNHPLFREKITFVDDGEEKEKNYTTLIIGSNGTGKSQLLKLITDIFLELNEYVTNKRGSFRFTYDFNLKYYCDNKLIELVFSNKVLKVFEGKKTVESVEIPLPTSILTLPYNFNDKFPINERVLIEKKGNAFDENYYKYLGLRSASNNIFISGPSKKVLDAFSNIIESEKEIKDLIPLFNLLNFGHKLFVHHKAGRHFNFLMQKDYLLNDNYSTDDFIKEYKSFWEEKNKSISKRFNDENFYRTLNDRKKISNVLSFLKKNPDLMRKEVGSRRIFRPLEIDLSEDKSVSKFQKEISPYNTLRDLDIFSFDRIDIEKVQSTISMEQISSGEYHLLFSMITLFAGITKRALVLIDEPEISLHPNWQMKYVDILNKIIFKSTSSHFLISSHSHLIVSDLSPNSSTIIGLNNNSGNSIETKVKTIDKNTFGWSTEQILLEIFDVPTTRNLYLTNEISKIISMLSKKELTDKQKQNLEKKIIWLKNLDLNLKAIDPLKEVVAAIIK